MKLHLVLDHYGYLTSFAVIMDGKCHDVKVAYLHFDPGTIVVDDRGCNDYHLFAKWASEEVSFVTRSKGNAIYTVIEEKDAPKNWSVLKDEIIVLSGIGAAENVLIPCIGSSSMMLRKNKSSFSWPIT